jgi:GNAT superfamily N-acetyltransferase
MLAQGHGFLLVHGLPVDELSENEIQVAYMGLGSHLGTRVGQNRHGDLITHIRDDRIPQTGEIKRLYRTRDRQDFHTDAADIIGLLCLHTARSGGESKIVSSRAVHDEMMRLRPDLGVMKKFFVAAASRGKAHGVAGALYDAFLDFARSAGIRQVVLDTPSAATRSHGFYRSVGFVQIERAELPVMYDFPERDTLFFRLEIRACVR